MFRDAAGPTENSFCTGGVRNASASTMLPNRNEIQTDEYIRREAGNHSVPSISSPTNWRRDAKPANPSSHLGGTRARSIPNFFTSNPLDEKFYHCGERAGEVKLLFNPLRQKSPHVVCQEGVDLD